MPIDRIRGMPIEKINDNRSKKTFSDEDESIYSIDSDLALLPPPRRSVMSRLSPRRMSRSRRLLLKGLICLTAMFLILICVPRHEVLVQEVKPIPKLAILLWNDENPDHQMHQCECVVTSERNYTNGIIDAIIFNADRNYSLEGLDKVSHTPNFLAVFAMKNPLIQAKYPLSKRGESIFNFTMTYRRDSDIIWSDYSLSELNNAEYSDSSVGDSVLDFVVRYKLSLKRQLAAYQMYEVNNSTDFQGTYLNELRKHMDLNVITTCHKTNECVPYKFMIIFEASCCPDYVHPQMYMALANYVVPVLVGGGNLTELLPPHSYILAEHFISAKVLATHLQYLSSHPDLYEEYFWWHTKYKIHHINRPYCALCRYLSHARAQRFNKYFLQWWTQYTCPDPDNFVYHASLLDL